MFSTETLKFSFDIRPLIWIRLENLHAPEIPPILMRALIGTGAARSVIPVDVCRTLGHDFESGSNPSAASGIGTGSIRTFTHATKLSILSTNWKETPRPEAALFSSFEFQMEFVEQNLPFALLDQRDFLKYFQYTQDGGQCWFSLKAAVEEL